MKNEKNFGAENVGWATAQLYCKGWRYCIVRTNFFVLQKLHCIAIEKTGLENFVLQYSYCIVGNSKLGIVLQEAWLQRDCIAIQKNCIVTRQGTWAGLYCNTATALAI